MMGEDSMRQPAGPGPLWRVGWATGHDTDPRLGPSLPTGAMRVADGGVVQGRLLVALSTCDSPAHSSAPGEQMRLWDLPSGESRVLMDAPAQCLSFASLQDDPVLVSGHTAGLVRIWDLPGGSLRRTLDVGNDDISDLRVIRLGDQTQMITLDVRGRVAQWRLDGREPVAEFDAPGPSSIWAGRLCDGQPVLATAGDALSWWDLSTGRRLPVTLGEQMPGVKDLLVETASGRDLVTVVDPYLRIATYDLRTGEQVADAIEAHRRQYADYRSHLWSHKGRRPRLTSVAGILAVPTAGGVHLWNPLTASKDQPPLTGAVSQAVVRTVRRDDRDWLLTGSAAEGVVSLWDLQVPVERPAGHEESIREIVTTSDRSTVISADEGGTICLHRVSDGHSVRSPLRTGIEGINALETWTDGGDIVLAAGAGSPRFPDTVLHRWNLTTGSRHGHDVKADGAFVSSVLRTRVHDTEAVITVGAEPVLKVWRTTDLAPLSRLRIQPARKTGLATGVLEGRPVAAVSAHRQPIHVVALDDVLLTPIAILDAEGDFVIALEGTRLITGHHDDDGAWRTVRAWALTGERLGAGVRATSPVTGAAVAGWPYVYLAREDRTVSLSNLETGRDLCPPMPLPRIPKALAVIGEGVVVGFGGDLTLILPPEEVAAQMAKL